MTFFEGSENVFFDECIIDFTKFLIKIHHQKRRFVNLLKTMILIPLFPPEPPSLASTVAGPWKLQTPVFLFCNDDAVLLELNVSSTSSVCALAL